MASLVEQNKSNISKNRRAVFDLEGDVFHNKAKIYAQRGHVAENAALINKNYQSAFLVNRQLAIENSEALFRNRLALASALPRGNDVEVNYREAKINQAKIDFLEHRTHLNSEVLAITKDLAAVNAAAIAVNRKIMGLNEEIKTFNAARIAENKALIEGPAATPSPESNASLVACNAKRIEEIKANIARNNAAYAEIDSGIAANKASALANAKEIADRFNEISHNHDSIVANRHLISERL